MMEDDDGSGSYKLVDDNEDSGNVQEEMKSERMLIMAEVSPDISHQFSIKEGERICVFKSEPHEVMEMDHFDSMEGEQEGMKPEGMLTLEVSPDMSQHSTHKGDERICSMKMEQFDTVEEVELDSLMKAEVVEQDVAALEEADGGAIQQVAPQQFIILTRTTGDNSEALELTDTGQTKYIRIDGTDGQTYVLAVTDDGGVLTSDHSSKTLVNQSATTPKKSGKNRPSGPSTVVTLPASVSSKTGSNPTSDGINQAWFTTKGDKAALHNNGHQWKQGQWTKEEIEILENNINTYCKEHSIVDPAEVIFEMSKDERKDFYRTVALGIQRPLFSVYRRVTRMYDQKNHRGKYSPSEMKHLKVLRAKHGNDWAAIGVALGRSASSVKDKCRLMKDNCNSGKWCPEEEERLAAAVYKLTGVKPSESITSGLSWASVAQQVGTRSEKQCRTKWLNYLNWKQQGGADWTREDDTLLIEKVSKMNVTNDSEIDWITLSQDWASVRSPQWLRGKWWALKRHIADYNKLDLPSLIQQMQQMVHWNLKPKLGPRLTKDTVAGSSSIYKGCIPVSITANADGTAGFSLAYGQEEEGFQAFEVLQQWTPQIIAQSTSTSDGNPAILKSAGGHIIVQTIGSLNEGMHLTGQSQVIISTSGVSHEELAGDESVIHVSEGQDLSGDNLHDNSITSYTSSGEEIITASEFHSQSESGDQDLMSHDVFVTSESSSDLVMGVTSSHHASSLMTSLKDPILMSSSDTECEKNQGTVLTDESSELID